MPALYRYSSGTALWLNSVQITARWPKLSREPRLSYSTERADEKIRPSAVFEHHPVNNAG